MALIGRQINTANYPQPDYSGVISSARAQAGEMANIGQTISGVMRDFSQVKQERRKVDALNKASAKAIDAALTLAKSYGITGAQETLQPFLAAAEDPNISPIEKAALLSKGEAMIGNLFGRFDKSQATALEKSAINARNAPEVKPLTYTPVLKDIGNGFLSYKTGSDGNNYDENNNLITNMAAYIEGQPIEVYSSGTRQSPADAISSAANMPTPRTAGGLVARSNAINNATPLPVDVYTDDTSQLPPVGTPNPLLLTRPEDAAAIDAILAQEQAAPVVGQPPASIALPPAPVVGEPPAMLARQPELRSRIIPSGESQQVETWRPATVEERAPYGGIPGQMSSKGRFYPITLPPGFIMETNSQGGIKFTQGAGVGGDLNKAPTTQIKEGEAIVPDATSPTGTRIVQIPSEAKEKAKTDFSGYMQQITGSYAALDAKGKAVTGEKSSIMNALTATGAGQAVSRALGSEDQVLRDQINTMRPSIVNVIRQATEMGAKGMDSEKELTFYLSAIGDPSLPVEANIKALETLDKVYGTGKAVNEMLKNFPDLKKKVDKYSFKSMPTSTTPTSGGTGLSPEVQKIREQLKSKSISQ